MKRTYASPLALVPVLALSTLPWLSADSVRVGGSLRAGFARPPLRVNMDVQEAAATPPYSPTQIRHAYGVDLLSVTGAGQKIAIVDAYGDPGIQTDLNNFSAYYGLASPTVQILYPQGPPTSGDNGWALETALDVEWAHAIAPDATIVVVVAKSNSDSDLIGAVDAAVNSGASVVSMSWGGSEFPGESAYDSHFNKPGVTFVASSGDSGESTGVEWPAASPYVVGVGGTSLYLDANGNRTTPEVGWSGSGGGISGTYGVPPFQIGWQRWGGGRGVPDVSLVADPSPGVAVAYGLYLYRVGGTSAGAPQWAALLALSNQAQGSPLTGGPAALYRLAGAGSSVNPRSHLAGFAPPISPRFFLDVTSGNNGPDPDDFSVTGYDLVTGLGSPVVANLVPWL
jgi:subtilase family serine protease